MIDEKIPKLNYRSPLLPDSIKKVIVSKRGDMIFNTCLDLGEGNAYVDSFSSERFDELHIGSNIKVALTKDYIKGFRQGYFEFKESVNFHIVTTALGYDFPFMSFSMFIRDGITKKYETFESGLENGKKYKAFEIILEDPLSFESLFERMSQNVTVSKTNEISKNKTVTNISNKSLTLKEVALYLFYSGTNVNTKNRDNLAKKYGFENGNKLYQNYNFWSQKSNRYHYPGSKQKLKNQIKRIEKVLDLLPENKKSRVVQELKSLRSHIDWI